MTLSDNQDDISCTIDFPSTYSNPHTHIKAYSFWVYVDDHDDDDNLALGVNLRRQSVGTMWIYARNPDTNDALPIVSEDTWHHICVVDEGTTMRTYQNGVSIGTHTINSAASIYWDDHAASIGDDGSARERSFFRFADANASNETFITGARMFNRALTQMEVTTLYNENPS